MELSHEDQIVAAIRQIIRAVDLHSRRLVHGHGLTGPQLAVLREVTRLEPVPPSVLARAAHLSQATVSGILKRLETRNLVSRQKSESDRRSVSFAITDDGKTTLAASPSLLQDDFRTGLSRLEEWERLQILSTLQRVATLMNAGHLAAVPHLTPGEIRGDDSQPTTGLNELSASSGEELQP
ncbi:MAG: MarR family transcriptional regulator [Planctomycetota bacterium]